MALFVERHVQLEKWHTVQERKAPDPVRPDAHKALLTEANLTVTARLAGKTIAMRHGAKVARNLKVGKPRTKAKLLAGRREERKTFSLNRKPELVQKQAKMAERLAETSKALKARTGKSAFKTDREVAWLTPVYVTNEGGLLPGGARTDLRRIAGSLGGKLFLGGTVLISAYAGWQIGKQINNALSKYIEKKTGGRDRNVGELVDTGLNRMDKARAMVETTHPVMSKIVTPWQAAVTDTPDMAAVRAWKLERETRFMDAIASFHAAEARGWPSAKEQDGAGPAGKIENHVHMDVRIDPDRVTTITDPDTHVEVRDNRGGF